MARYRRYRESTVFQTKKKYTDIQENISLTINELVEKIVVHRAQGVGRTKRSSLKSINLETYGVACRSTYSWHKGGYSGCVYHEKSWLTQVGVTERLLLLTECFCPYEHSALYEYS